MQLARAYNRWLCDKVLVEEPRIRSMLYLPFNDPEACIKMVEDFADKKGVIGFMVTAPRHRGVFDNAYMKLYAMLRGARPAARLPRRLHAGTSVDFNAGQPLHRGARAGLHLLQHAALSNWVMNALPERFPKLKAIWIESGLAWVPFLMQRLDNEYMMRTSEAPGLKRKPTRLYARHVLHHAADGDGREPRRARD